MDSNSNLSAGPTLIGGPENMKLLFDIFTQKASAQAQLPNAWEALAQRVANDSWSVSHFINMTTAGAGQTGLTGNQQTTGPIRTAAADNLAAGATPANRVTDTSGAVAGAAVNDAISGIAAAVAKSVNDSITDELATLTETIQGLADSQAAIAAALGALKPAAATS